MKKCYYKRVGTHFTNETHRVSTKTDRNFFFTILSVSFPAVIGVLVVYTGSASSHALNRIAEGPFIVSGAVTRRDDCNKSNLVRSEEEIGGGRRRAEKKI